MTELISSLIPAKPVSSIKVNNLNKEEKKVIDILVTHTRIYFLANSFQYFLYYVFIIPGPSGFRLIVISQWRVLSDQYFPTLSQAKKFFIQTYGSWAHKDYSTPDWNDNYYVENKWLKKFINMTQRHPVLNYLVYQAKELCEPFIRMWYRIVK